MLFGFDGRIGRGAFWFSLLAVLMLDMAVLSVTYDWIQEAYFEAGVPIRPGGAMVGAGFGLLAVAALSAWAALGLAFKRAHDIDRSGWWLTIGLIPVVGVVILFKDLGLRAGSTRRNRFGDPIGFVEDEDVPEHVAPTVQAAPALERLFAEPEPELELEPEGGPREEAAPVGEELQSAAPPPEAAVSAEPEPEAEIPPVVAGGEPEMAVPPEEGPHEQVAPAQEELAFAEPAAEAEHEAAPETVAEAQPEQEAEPVVASLEPAPEPAPVAEAQPEPEAEPIAAAHEPEIAPEVPQPAPPEALHEDPAPPPARDELTLAEPSSEPVVEPEPQPEPQPAPALHEPEVGALEPHTHETLPEEPAPAPAPALAQEEPPPAAAEPHDRPAPALADAAWVMAPSGGSMAANDLQGSDRV
jgi:uncharacterized membrane protein YhaH (DUF805 family)